MPVSKPKKGPQWRRKYLARLIDAPWSRRARVSPALRKHLDEQGYITPHFSWASYACSDGTPVPQSLRANAIRLHWRLEILRHRLGDQAMVVDGPYRTRQRNRQVGGASDSRHVHADGADFFLAQVDRWAAGIRRPGESLAAARSRVVAIASKTFYAGGLGNEGSGTLHVDQRGTRVRFVTWVAGR